jgi:hypothetical protein
MPPQDTALLLSCQIPKAVAPIDLSLPFERDGSKFLNCFLLLHFLLRIDDRLDTAIMYKRYRVMYIKRALPIYLVNCSQHMLVMGHRVIVSKLRSDTI